MNNQVTQAMLKSDNTKVTKEDMRASAQREYEKPILLCYGDVRDVTLGPTPGFGESGCECDRKPGASIDCPVPPSPCFP